MSDLVLIHGIRGPVEFQGFLMESKQKTGAIGPQPFVTLASQVWVTGFLSQVTQRRNGTILYWEFPVFRRPCTFPDMICVVSGVQVFWQPWCSWKKPPLAQITFNIAFEHRAACRSACLFVPLPVCKAACISHWSQTFCNAAAQVKLIFMKHGIPPVNKAQPVLSSLGLISCAFHFPNGMMAGWGVS